MSKLKKHAIFLVIIAFFLNRIIFALRFHRLIWDEAVYLAMGKFIYSLGNAGFWEIVRPIGLPFILGASWRLGFDYIFSAEVIALIFSSATIFMTYKLAEIIFDRTIAIISSLILICSSVFFFYSGHVLTGIPSTFFCLIAVYLFLKERYVMSAIMAGTASYFRLPQGLILIGIIISYSVINLRNKLSAKNNVKNILNYLKIFIYTMIPYFIFNIFVYHDEVTRLHHAIFRPWILGIWSQTNPSEMFTGSNQIITFLGNVFYYIYFPIFGKDFLIGNIFLIGMPLGIFFILKSKLIKKKTVFTLFVTFAIYLSYYSFIPNKQMRFLLVFLPFYSILSAFGLCRIIKKIGNRNFKTILLAVVMIGLLILYSQNQNYVNFRPKTAPKIHEEYHGFLENKEGKIISTDPVIGSYLDNKIIPIYSIWIAEKVYKKNKQDRGAVVLSPGAFYCSSELCENKLNEFHDIIKQENKLVFNQSFSGKGRNRTYLVYVPNNIKNE